jgi:HSP20 family protein
MDATVTKPIVKNGAEKPVARLDPFSLFDEMQAELQRFWAQPWAPFPTRFAFAPVAWAPRTDIFEKEGMLVVKVELPGVEKEHIAVTLEQGDLIIRGERKAEAEVKEEAFYRVERTYGTFYRRIPLPFEVKAEEITAEYKDGILEVHIPKPVKELPKAHKVTLK